MYPSNVYWPRPLFGKCAYKQEFLGEKWKVRDQNRSIDAQSGDDHLYEKSRSNMSIQKILWRLSELGVPGNTWGNTSGVPEQYLLSFSNLLGYLGIRFCSTLITIYHQNFTQELFLVFEKNWDFFLKNTALEANSVASALLLASFMDNCFLKHSKDFLTFLGSSYTVFFVLERSSLDFVNQLVDEHAECPIFHPFLSSKRMFDVRFSNHVI